MQFLKEITKLVTMDLAMTIASILVIDFLRGLWVRYCNIWWFWNLECTFVSLLNTKELSVLFTVPFYHANKWTQSAGNRTQKF